MTDPASGARRSAGTSFMNCNQRIDATTVALAALDSTLTSEHTKLAIQKGATLAKDTFREALPAKIARIQGAVVAAFGLGSPVFMECFPHGREIFGDCTDAAQVGQIHIDNVGGLVSTWTGLFAAASSARGVRNSSAAARRAATDGLRNELFLNLLALATAFPNQEEKAALYCPQHLSEDHPQKEDEDEAVNE